MKPSTTTRRPPPPVGTQAVARALGILRAFDDTRPGWALSELAAHLGLAKSTALRLLGALERAGLVSRQGPAGSYRLGSAAIELGARAQRANTLPGVARADLEALATQTREAASLEVLVGDEILVLDEVLGTHLVGRSPCIGTRWPAHAASTGKVLLAAAREGQGEPWQGAPMDVPLRLVQCTPRTITSPARLALELNRVIKQGYATAVGEMELGYVAVAAPIVNHTGKVVAAIGVGGPSTRITEARLTELSLLVKRSAQSISRKLGRADR